MPDSDSKRTGRSTLIALSPSPERSRAPRPPRPGRRCRAARHPSRSGTTRAGGRRSRVQDLAGDHELLDLRGALVKLRDLGVAEVPLDLVVLDEPIAAVDLDSVGRHLHGRLRGE